MSTRARVLDAAMSAIGRRGVDGASLASVADEVGITKQAVLYHFSSKSELVRGVVDAAISELDGELRAAVHPGERGWPAVERLVRAAFSVAARRPEVLVLLREAARQGPPLSAHVAERLRPLLDDAERQLRRDMDDGLLRVREPRVLLLTFHAVVVGVSTETELMRAVGMPPDVRSLVIARRELLSLLRDALTRRCE
ncbi:MAG: TetR/AcrR family transcriptional regulator [Actinomycetota bacterium]